MNRVALVISGIVIGVVGTSFLFAPSVMSASADNYTMARATSFVWEDGSSPPEGASEFCLQVYEGTRADVTIIMTLPDGMEAIGAPIEDFYAMTDTSELVPVRTCFDDDVANDPQGNVSPIKEAQAELLNEPVWGNILPPNPGATTVNGCGINWNGQTAEEMRPGWWKIEQDKFQANLEAAIARNEPGLSLEEASLKSWAGRVEVGPDVTTMDLPTWMRNLIIPYCDLSAEDLAAVRGPGYMPPPSEEQLNPGDELTRATSLYVANETQAMYAWIEQNAPGISLEEAGQLWVDGNAAGWVDSLGAPWGICAATWMAPDSLSPAGISLPEWISSRIIGYGDGPDCN